MMTRLLELARAIEARDDGQATAQDIAHAAVSRAIRQGWLSADNTDAAREAVVAELDPKAEVPAVDPRWAEVDRLKAEALAADKARGKAAAEAMAAAGAVWVATNDLGGDWVDDDGGPVRGHRLMVGGRNVAQTPGNNPGQVAGAVALGVALPPGGDWAEVDRLRDEILEPAPRPDPVEAFRSWWDGVQALAADARRAQFRALPYDVQGAAQAAGLSVTERRALL